MAVDHRLDPVRGELLHRLSRPAHCALTNRLHCGEALLKVIHVDPNVLESDRSQAHNTSPRFAVAGTVSGTRQNAPPSGPSGAPGAGASCVVVLELVDALLLLLLVLLLLLEPPHAVTASASAMSMRPYMLSPLRVVRRVIL